MMRNCSSSLLVGSVPAPFTGVQHPKPDFVCVSFPLRLQVGIRSEFPIKMNSSAFLLQTALQGLSPKCCLKGVTETLRMTWQGPVAGRRWLTLGPALLLLFPFLEALCVAHVSFPRAAVSQLGIPILWPLGVYEHLWDFGTGWGVQPHAAAGGGRADHNMAFEGDEHTYACTYARAGEGGREGGQCARKRAFF